MTTLVYADRLVTCSAAPGDPLGVIERGFLAIDGDRVVDVGAAGERPRESDATILSAPLVTPGLVDAHTHAAWVGSRHAEYEVRLAGGDYEAIAKAGGGIVSSMRSVRAASTEVIAATLEARVRRMAALGVTTLEVKSGYGLDPAGETKQLAAVAAVAPLAAVPTLVPTYLALHALPPEANGDREAYAREVAERGLDAMAKAAPFRFVDAYIDRSAFSVAQARPTLEKARALGFGIRLHVGQFADVGGAELAADLGAASVDHLEQVSEAAIARLASAGVRAVLLPVASFTLGQAPPPVAALRTAGVPLVVASDANPGTAPTESLPLALAFAVRSYGLSVAEAILGATREAALSLELPDRGVLATGKRADVVLWDLPHEAAIVQPWGAARTSGVIIGGKLV
jgi:imidazolonepropionase